MTYNLIVPYAYNGEIVVIVIILIIKVLCDWNDQYNLNGVNASTFIPIIVIAIIYYILLYYIVYYNNTRVHS